MARFFDPTSFSAEARNAAAEKLKLAAEQVTLAERSFLEAQEILREDSGREGLVFPFFEGYSSDLQEISESAVLTADRWSAEES